MTIPTLLTLVRLISSIFIVPFLIVFLLPLNDPSVGTFLALFCTVLVLTDFFDGYLARKYRQETALGKVLDPLADKCFVIASLIALVALQRIYFYWALVIITRELLITGLREAAHHYKFNLDVAMFGKLKAALQYFYIIFIVGAPWSIDTEIAVMIETALLVGMLFFTIFSGLLYFKRFIAQWCAITQEN